MVTRIKLEAMSKDACSDPRIAQRRPSEPQSHPSLGAGSSGCGAAPQNQTRWTCRPNELSGRSATTTGLSRLQDGSERLFKRSDSARVSPVSASAASRDRPRARASRIANRAHELPRSAPFDSNRSLQFERETCGWIRSRRAKPLVAALRPGRGRRSYGTRHPTCLRRPGRPCSVSGINPPRSCGAA